MATYNGIELPPLPGEEPRKKVHYMMIQHERRLIDADEMKNNIMEAMIRQFKKRGDQSALRIAEMMWHFIDEIDAVDAVEVVHGRWEMDGVLREIFGDDLIPFQKRYPIVKQYGYLKSRKGWK